MADFRASRVGRLDSGSSESNLVEVQVLSSAPMKSRSCIQNTAQREWLCAIRVAQIRRSWGAFCLLETSLSAVVSPLPELQFACLHLQSSARGLVEKRPSSCALLRAPRHRSSCTGRPSTYSRVP